MSVRGIKKTSISDKFLRRLACMTPSAELCNYTFVCSYSDTEPFRHSRLNRTAVVRLVAARQTDRQLEEPTEAINGYKCDDTVVQQVVQTHKRLFFCVYLLKPKTV